MLDGALCRIDCWGAGPESASLPFAGMADSNAGACRAVYARLLLRESRIDALTNAVRYNSARIELELGHRNRVSLEEGVTELVEAWKKYS